MTLKFTQQEVTRAGLPAGKSEHIEFDEAMPGFGVRIRAGKKTHRTFIVQFKIGAKHRRITLGNVAKVPLENARKEARKIFGRVANGEDPQNDKVEARRAAPHTLKATIAKYLEARAKAMRPRSHDETSRHLEKHWQPLHGFTLSSIGRANVAAQVAAIAKARGPVAANRSRASLSAMFRWAIGEGLCEENPVAGTNRQDENGPRERALTDAEAAAVWLAVSDDDDYGRLVRLILLTGCRRTELGGLKWSEIDVDGRTITVPAERTKNNQQHVLPLSDPTLAILEAIPRREGRDRVFGIGGFGFCNWSKCKTELDKLVALKEPWTLHDLRRTVRTGLGKLGVQLHIAEAVLNHLPPKLIRTYDRNTYAAENKAALDLWASNLMVAVAQATGANVTALKPRR